MNEEAINLPWIWPKDLDSEFEGANDRAVAIVGGSYLETMLQLLLQGFLVNHSSTADLFKAYGPFSSFTAKIQASFALGLISDNERGNLNLIRRIRNDFAHELRATSFNDQAISGRCRELNIPQRMYVPSKIRLPSTDRVAEINLTVPGPDEPRARFVASFNYMQLCLTFRLQEAQLGGRRIPQELISATDSMRKTIAYFDNLQRRLEQLRSELGERNAKRGNLEPIVGQEQDDKKSGFDVPGPQATDLVSLFMAARPVIELTIELLERAYYETDEASSGSVAQC